MTSCSAAGGSWFVTRFGIYRCFGGKFGVNNWTCL